MKQNTQTNSTDKVGWIVRFVGTPFMDGVYTEEEFAVQIKEHMEEKYPSLRFEVADVPADFRFSNDIFWACHQDEIDVLNSGRTYPV